jgi:hypothetical protein
MLLGSMLSTDSTFSQQELRVLNNIWKSPAPSKVIAFSWQLLRNRLPTRVNLEHSGIQGLGDCFHCQGREEEVTHLFLLCDFAAVVWNAIFRWLGLVFVILPNSFLLFESFIGAAVTKKERAGFALIWHATGWTIWKSRSNIIFSNGVIDAMEAIDAIKLLSWR